MNRTTETKRTLKYEFPDPEKLEMGKEMAQLDRDIKLLEEEKKSTVSGYVSRINEKEARRTRLSNNIADGFDHREIECEIKYNSPKDGVKQVIRKDSKEVVEEISMTPEELQEEMDFKEEKSKKAEEKKEAKRKAKLEKDNKRRQEKRQAMQKKKAESGS
jgi:hypothetical protein